MQLQPGCVAVVTGGASGIGLALAEAAATAGLRILLVDRRAEALEEAAAQLREAGADVTTLVADVAHVEDIEHIADTAFGLGRVQLVCSNAGIVVHGPSWLIPAAEWKRVMDVNFMATVHLVRAFVPRLLEVDAPAHLIVTGSMASVTARAGISPYVAAKHALLGLCETLHHELIEAQAPIGVTLLLPGQVATGMSRAENPAAITPQESARCAFEAVARDQLFVFTHDERIPEVRERFAAIVEQRNPDRSGAAQ